MAHSGRRRVQLHYILHTEVAKWLKTQSANGNDLDATTGNMPNDKPKDQSESKFAEVIRKGKEKRSDMQQESERRATSAELESLVRGEINDADEPSDA